MPSKQQSSDGTLPRRIVGFGALLILGMTASPGILLLLFARDGESLSIAFALLVLPVVLILVWLRRSIFKQMVFAPRAPPDTWGRLWLRCWIAACFLFLLARLRAAHLPNSLSEILVSRIDLLGSVCGLVLFVISLVNLKRRYNLAWLGLVVSIPTVALAFLPGLAKN